MEPENTTKVLVVDDDEVVRCLHVELLSELGYSVHEASCAEEALAVLEDHIYDVVLSDVMMLRTDGIDLAKMLRRDARYADMPIVLVTALDDRETRIYGLQVADAVLTKPIDKAELSLQLEMLLRTRARVLALRQQLDEQSGVWNTTLVDPPVRRTQG